MSIALGELAVRFGCELRGDPDAARRSRRGAVGAGAGALSFLANPRLKPAAGRHARRRRGARAARALAACPVAALIDPNPHALFARIAALLHPAPPLRSRGCIRARWSTPQAADRSERRGRRALRDRRAGARSARAARSAPAASSGRSVQSAPTAAWSRASRSSAGVQLGERVLIHPARSSAPTASGSRARRVAGSRCRRSARAHRR